jgi:hypothetical protein
MAKKRSVPARASARARTPGPSRRRAQAAAGKGPGGNAPLVIATPQRQIPLRTQDLDPSGRITQMIQRAAMQWTYVVRNRRRWSGRDSLVQEQSIRAQADLRDEFGLTKTDLTDLAAARVAQVIIPYDNEETGWETRVFPWEFVISSATRPFRRGEPLTVLRQLVRSRKVTSQATGAPRSVLYVESAPGALGDEYSFDSERTLVQTSLGTAVAWHEIKNPTRKSLGDAVKAIHPDIVHLAGFDTHQGLRILEAISGGATKVEAAAADNTEVPVRQDGYILAGEADVVDTVAAQDLAAILCADPRKPRLVSCNIWNSGSRICPMLVAAGAGAAIGFQDSFEDEIVESFYSTLYQHWRHARWQLGDAFCSAWEKLRQKPSGLLGSGVILWSDSLLVSKVEAQAVANRASRVQKSLERETERVLSPERESVDGLITIAVKPVEELNYSLLHNRRPLFEDFKLVKRKPGRMAGIAVNVSLNAGGQTFPFEKTLDLVDNELDLRKEIHASLTGDLARSLREAINTSLRVEVLWQQNILYQETHRVRLLPADQWRDTDEDRKWLPCFVLPRDPAVGKLIEKAHQYVRVLRDDPSAGFDGYQSVDTNSEDPTEGVDLQVQAIWSAILHEWQLGYVNPPPTYSKGLDSQRLRTPSTILGNRSGTCIDLALLVAACLELVDIYPVVFLLDSHAFPGYWRSDTAHEDFLKAQGGRVDVPADPKGTVVTGTQNESWISGRLAYDEIVRQIDRGCLVPIESVMLTENCGFWEAVQAGKDNLRPKREFNSMVDVLSARFDRVTPLPISETGQ